MNPCFPSPRRRTELKQAIGDCRSAFFVVAVFSLAINLLMLTPAIYMLQVYDRVLTTNSLETLLMLTLIICASLLAMSALESLRTIVTIRTGVWLNNRLGPVLIERSVRARLKGESAGAQALHDLAQVQSFIATNGLSFLFDGPWVPIFLCLIWLQHPTLGLTAIAAALLMLVLTMLSDLLTRQPTHTANLKHVAATQQVEAAVRNAEVIHSMGMMPAVIEQWQSQYGTAMTSLLRGSEISGSIQGTTKFIRFFVQSGMLGIGAFLVIKGEMSAGAMIAASILLGRALAPVELAMGVWRNLLNARFAYNRIQALLLQVPPEPERIRLPAPVGRLVVDRLTYVPPGSNRPVLRGVSFQIEPGEALAIIGPSAAGKSTLCRFLVGIAAATGGSVRVDGAELIHWNREQLGQCVGYLPQDVELFAGTVRRNIARMAAEPDDGAVVEAAMLAQAHDMITGLSDGYDTQIGDGGALLSAGQRQRLALARAVYGNPALVILDEPNANLDTAGESALAAALAELKARGTALVIVGHRPSTLAQADKLMWMRDGQVER